MIIDRSLFRAYDIRGNAETLLTEAVVRRIGQAFAMIALDAGVSELVVARDGRLSGPRLQGALMQGLEEGGMQVIDAGELPSPLLYFAALTQTQGTGIIVSASHNPAQDNGLKLMLQGETWTGEQIYAVIASERERSVMGSNPVSHANARNDDIVKLYLEQLCQDICFDRPLTVVVDGGHSVGGPILVQALTRLGASVVPLYCEVDGHFPAHDPDPSRPENLKSLQETVLRLGADLGIALDGDGDRLGVVDHEGVILWPDQLMMLFAEAILAKSPAATILYDVKCSRHLAEKVRTLGGTPVICRTGHSFMKAKIKETRAAFAGEMSGHLFFADRWFGFDDGIYAACRLIELLSQRSSSLSDWRMQLPLSVATSELSIAVKEGAQFHIVEQFVKNAHFPTAELITVDGLRIERADGWALVRSSNTAAHLILRFEAETQAALKQLQTQVKEQLLHISPDLLFSF